MKKHRFELAIPPAGLLALLLALIMLAGRFLTIANFEFAAQTWLAIGLASAGFLVMLAGVVSFFRHSTSVDPRDPSVASTLVDSGIFARTRNPMYLGMALILAGTALGIGNWLALVLVPFFIVWITRFQIAPEERVLEEMFGDAFAAYRQRTRRWL